MRVCVDALVDFVFPSEDPSGGLSRLCFPLSVFGLLLI
jgi:hypothetical protein